MVLGDDVDGPRCRECGRDTFGTWEREAYHVRDRCFEHAIATIKFVARHLPKSGGPWHLVIKDCQYKEVENPNVWFRPYRPPGSKYGVRTLRELLEELPRSVVASWKFRR